MKKLGFTLAEVLITLGIIGVVAAITLPSLNTAVQKNKVGPSLRKFVNTMENANEHILGDKDSDLLSQAVNSETEYYRELMKFVQGSATSIGSDDPEDVTAQENVNEWYNKIKKYGKTTYAPGPVAPGSPFIIYTFSSGAEMVMETKFGGGTPDDGKGSYKGAVAWLFYDINGFDSEPNIIGKDIFLFNIDDSGAIIPDGGKQHYNSSVYVNKEQEWKDGNELCNATTVTNGYNCAGSIADNGWKVIYKY